MKHFPRIFAAVASLGCTIGAIYMHPAQGWGWFLGAGCALAVAVMENYNDEA